MTTTENPNLADEEAYTLTPEDEAALMGAEASRAVLVGEDDDVIDPETGEITPAPKASDLARVDKPAADDDGPGRLLITRRVLMIKSLLPDANWINREVVAKGEGPPVWLGRIFGNAVGWELKHYTQSDGRVTESIALRGKFESESLHGVEPQSGTTVYLPMAYAEQAAAIFQAAGVESGASGRGMVVSVDCDLGLEWTKRPIPYAWVVKAFLRGRQMDTLRNLRNQRKVGQPLPEAPALPGGPEAPALAAPASEGAPAAAAARLADGEAPEGLRNVTPGADD